MKQIRNTVLSILLVIGIALTSLMAVQVERANAVAISSGCASLQDSSWDARYGSHRAQGVDLWAGDTITATVTNAGNASYFVINIDHTVTSRTLFTNSNTATYSVPETLYNIDILLQVWLNTPGDWVVDCSPGDPPPPPSSDDPPSPSPGDSAPTDVPAIPGPDMIALPPGSVVGAFVTNTPLYFAPSTESVIDVVISAGKTLWVTGTDNSGAFYQVVLSGDFYWVPIESMGPNYDDVWNGTPLPTTSVE